MLPTVWRRRERTPMKQTTSHLAEAGVRAAVPSPKPGPMACAPERVGKRVLSIGYGADAVFGAWVGGFGAGGVIVGAGVALTAVSAR